MLLNPGVRIQTAHNYLVRAKDRASGDYTFVFGAYKALQKMNMNDTDALASGGVSVSFATRSGGSNAGSNAKAVFNCDGAATLSSGTPIDEDEVEVFEIETGVGLFWGSRPKVKTRRQYIGGDGTKIMVYVETGTFPTVEHVVLVDPANTDQARIYKLDGSGQPGASPDVTLSTALLYAKLKTDGTFETSTTVPGGIADVVAYAKQQAAAAGY